jgi:hypothetical protein
VLYVALAFSILAVLVGVVVASRAGLRFSRRLRRLDELASAAGALSARSQELSAASASARASLERLRALALTPA